MSADDIDDDKEEFEDDEDATGDEVADNVIDFFSARAPKAITDIDTSDVPVRKAYPLDEGCAHSNGFVIDMKTRTVECRQCKEAINAIDALGSMADTWDRWAKKLDDGKRYLAAVTADFEKLKRNKDNMRRTKDGKVNVVEVDPNQYSNRPDAGVRLGQMVLDGIREGRPVLFTPKPKT